MALTLVRPIGPLESAWWNKSNPAAVLLQPGKESRKCLVAVMGEEHRCADTIRKRCRQIVAVLLLSIRGVVAAQEAAGTSAIRQGAQAYAEHCIVCHGVDARGTERAPQLAGNRALSRQSIEQVRALIYDGVPDSGMPAFDLPPPELDALAAFVRSLNAPAAESAVAGDAKSGERFFFGKGQCDSCHMVYGRGRPIGPDLSETGRTLSVDEIRKALAQPGAHRTPGYDFVTVTIPSGQTLRGFARSRGSSEIQLQDLSGRFHLLHGDRIAAIREEQQSPMTPVTASPVELQNLIAYLAGLTGVKPGMLAPLADSEDTEPSFSRISNPRPGDWLTYNGMLGGNRYSNLAEINRTNVARLVAKWVFSIPYFGLEVTPVVDRGIMYVTGPNQAFALDALTGRQIWHYSRPRSQGMVGDAALGTNRGVALLGDKVFMVTDNAHLIALNRVTGRPVWEAVMADEPQHYGSTSAPLVVKDMVIAGVSGADEGIRGFVCAYKAASGERVWRRWTIPRKGEAGYETWKGKDPELGGGSTWLTGTYDVETGTLYWPTGNPFPDGDDREREGDNLFTDCILALDPGNGALKWYYQFTPHDVRDWDATEPPVLVDTSYRGRDRKLLLHADRNGFFYVFDRTDGELLFARKFVNHLTWASGIGPDGRPQLLPGYLPPPEGEIGCPTSATNWMSTAFSAVTRLYYVMAVEDCGFFRAPGSWKPSHFQKEPGKKYLRALDVETGNVVWEVPQTGPADGKRWAGVLATAGGIVLYGDPSGEFAAVDERDGQRLWQFPTNQDLKASPMTYTADGKQLVALAAGPSILCFGLP
jgi:PQQ-dependent dehydrogenase (methanol/ethanol family)